MNYKIILCLVFILALSCNKYKLRDYSGEATALKNNVQWEALPFARKSSLNESWLVISFDYYNDQKFLRESLVIFKVPFIVAEHKVIKTGIRDETDSVGAEFYTSTDDGDVTGDKYYINDSDTSSIFSVTEINANKISGEFDLILIRDTTREKSNPQIPDTLNIRNGEFHTKIREAE